MVTKGQRVGKLLALVVVASSTLAFGVACGGGEFDDDSPRADGKDSSEIASQSSNGGAAAAATSAAGGNPAPGLPAAASIDRKIIFSATIALDVTDVAAAFDRIGAIARTNGGFVEKSTFAGNDHAESRSGSLTLRVPVQSYEDTLTEVRQLQGATVRNQSSKSNEVTEQYTDLQSRLRNLERTEQQYLTLLQQAKTIQEILTLTDRLDSVRGQIEQAQGRLAVLDDQTEFATVDVALAPIAMVREERTGPKGVSESFFDAWAASLEVGRYMASAAAALLVIAGWLAIPAGLVFVALRLSRRHGGPTIATASAAEES